MTPEQLHSWQPQATPEQLAEFIAQNTTLLTLLEEAWAKYASTLPPKPPAPSQYAVGISPDQLEHYPISHEEMIQFLNHFDKERQHDSNPFGKNVHITEQNWTIDGD